MNLRRVLSAGKAAMFPARDVDSKRVEVAAGEQAVQVNPPIIMAPPSLELRNQISILHSVVWGINQYEFEQRALNMRGYALVDPSEYPLAIPLRVNDKPVGDMEWPLRSLGQAKNLPLVPFAKTTGFTARFDSGDEPVFNDDGFVDITLQLFGQHRNNALLRVISLYDPAREQTVPDTENTKRVIGGGQISGFLRTGATSFRRLENYLALHHDRPLSTFKRVLDWGCGAGRLTRYLTTLDNVDVTGIDIDDINVQWCKSSITGAAFETVATAPPTRFDEKSFDLIVGISIFTHLREPDQFAWLEELQRIVSDDGLVMVSYHGPTVLGFVRAKQPLLEEIEKQGIFITGNNNQVDNIGDDEYYVNVSHSRRYILENWGKYFEIIDVVPGFFGRQDMVVMKKRP